MQSSLPGSVVQEAPPHWLRPSGWASLDPTLQHGPSDRTIGGHINAQILVDEILSHANAPSPLAPDISCFSSFEKNFWA